LTALRDHNETLKGENEALKSQLAAERARTEKAIAAFSALAERLDALAAERAKPWGGGSWAENWAAGKV